MIINRITTAGVLIAAATVAGAPAEAQQRPQPRPMSINEWLQAERNNANMQRAVEEYERARYGTATPQQAYQPQPAYQPQQAYQPPQPAYRTYAPEQAQAGAPQAAPQQPVQPQPLTPNEPPGYQQPRYPQQQVQPQYQPQPYPDQAQPGGQIPQYSNQQNTYQVPPNALEKIDREYSNSTPVFSGGTGYYVSANLGWSFLGNSNADFGVAEIDIDTSMLSLHSDAALGYKLGNGLSLELSGTYRYSTADELTLEIPVAGFSTSRDNVEGSVSVLAMLANARFELPVGQNMSPYVLGGVGPGIHFINDVKASGGTSSLDDSALTLAYQFGAGLMMPINSRTSLDIGYRYFGTTDADMETSGVEYEADFSSHSLIVGFTQQL